jgi:DNA repair exonuclease SbcCD ATPase subunit
MEKINLNFFGEEVSIEIPKDLALLRTKISEKYSLSSSDASEIILYYIKDTKKTYIINENDFTKFKELKISTIFLDVNQNSKLYLDNVTQIKEEIKKEEENKKEKEKVNEEKKEEDKKEEIDVEKAKEEISKLDSEIDEITKKQKEKNKLYNDKISEVIKQIVELEKLKDHLNMEKDLDFYELKDKKTELEKKRKEIKKKIEPEIVLKASKPAPKFTGGYRSGQNNFPYSKAALDKNFENQRKYFEKLNAAKEKRMKERKALEEQKSLEAKNEINLKDIQTNIPGTIPVFEKVNKY